MCLEGIQCAIRIACIFGFSLERSAFVQALATFTSLTDKNHAAEIKTKNIEAIKGLISVAYSDGNHLETSWLDVMKCISQLEAAQNNVSGLRNFNNSSNILDGGVDSEPSGINETNSQSILVAVDRIFTGMTLLFYLQYYFHFTNFFLSILLQYLDFTNFFRIKKFKWGCYCAFCQSLMSSVKR